MPSKLDIRKWVKNLQNKRRVAFEEKIAFIVCDQVDSTLIALENRINTLQATLTSSMENNVNFMKMVEIKHDEIRGEFLTAIGDLREELTPKPKPKKIKKEEPTPTS